MNPIKKKLSNLLTDAVKKAVAKMDAEDSCARSLEGLDRDAVVEKDVQRICNELSTLEAARILSLGAQLASSRAGDAYAYRKIEKEVKSLLFEVLRRVENKGKKLNLPPECEDMLLDLL